MTRPAHWLRIELPEDNGDPRLLDACWALMDVVAIAPADVVEMPVLDSDPDLGDLPWDHHDGTRNDPITLVAVVRLAKAALAVADRAHDLGTAVIERAADWHHAWNWQTTKPDEYRDAVMSLVLAVDRFATMERAIGGAHEPEICDA